MEKNLPFTPETAYEAAAILYTVEDSLSEPRAALRSMFEGYLLTDYADNQSDRFDAVFWFQRFNDFFDVLEAS